MLRASTIPGLVLLAAFGVDARCPAQARGASDLAAHLAVARAGCVRCHAASPELTAHFAGPDAPDLGQAVAWHADDGGTRFLRTHHGGAAAADLAAWLRARAGDESTLRAASASPGRIEHGAQLFASLACMACHARDGLDDLAHRTDHAHVTAFLLDPGSRRPGLVHDFGLDADAAGALAAWILRAQLTEASKAPAQPGFAYECFEVRIDDEGLPDLDGVQPSAQGLTTKLDATLGTRENHFALRFTATLDVPASGEWTFFCGSDDSSWLWIDDRLVVRNEAIAPYRERQGKVHLDAGPHALRLMFTEAAGGEQLDVHWRGPGVKKQPIPAARAAASATALAPPPPLPVPAPEAVARGRAAVAARRCATCHTIDDDADPASPAPAPAWTALRDGACPQVVGADVILAAARRTAPAPPNAARELRFALHADRCVACHVRDGEGGLPTAAKDALAMVEDLGDEGRLPPDLTAVGHRLHPAWIEKVLREGHKVRPYVQVRMPRIEPARAQQYARWFDAVDARPGDDDEPAFSLPAAQLGQQLAGTTGRACITCHPIAGRKALGPQGMDLAHQHARLRPAWFREWLLHPAQLRPGTRMPGLWADGDPQARREVDAIRTWLSLGGAAPLPIGLADNGRSLQLEPQDRPRLHGAFLRGLSARCVAVGTPLRTHFAYDVEHARLAWLWRGAFLDASGTWSGRAGQLLEPLGQDWVVLDDLDLRADGDATRTVLGHRVDAAGYPIWHVRVGAAEFDDRIEPRLAAGGSEIVRSLHVSKGTLTLDVPASTAGVRLELTPVGTRSLRAGQDLQIVYRW